MTKYEKLVKDFTKRGFTVKETVCVETVGYDKPTDEYLFTVELKRSRKKIVELVYDFKNDKNVIDHVQMWETKLELVEKETIKIF
jgi:hypothetical protein